MKIGMHVSVRETGERGVVVSVDGESATIRLRMADRSLSASESTFALSALKGEKGRPVHPDRLIAAPSASEDAPATGE